MDLVNQPVGAEGSLKIVLEAGKVKLVAGYDGKGGGAEFSAHLSPEYFVQLLKNAIPGKVDDMIFDALLAMLPK
jgi:hypothetical protein